MLRELVHVNIECYRVHVFRHKSRYTRYKQALAKHIIGLSNAYKGGHENIYFTYVECLPLHEFYIFFRYKTL